MAGIQCKDYKNNFKQKFGNEHIIDIVFINKCIQNFVQEFVFDFERFLN